MSHVSPRGRHRTPSRIANLSTTARVTAAVAVTSGLVATVGAPANAAQGQASMGSKSATTTKAAAAPRAAALPATGTTSGAATGAVQAGRVQLPEMVRAHDLLVKAKAKPVAKPATRVSRSTERPRVRVAKHAATSTTRTAAPARHTVSPRHAAPEAPKAAPKPLSTVGGSSSATGTRAQIIAIAKQYIGTPYVYAGSSPSGFDCSGFTSYVFAKAGVSLPHRAAAQRAMANPTSNPQPGDLAFYGGSHVMIYLGNGMMIDASHPGTTVQIRKVGGSATFGSVL